ncbi:MAG: hypothetical protein KAY37_07610 [Phycisphaerae bacterium]|nr:hypothetical protein [Phycisphaerae bacterium]
MKRRKAIVVTKRDGSAECFSVTRLSSCLARGLQARAYAPRLAGPLARAVTLHLREWSDDQPPTTQYVFRCVCSVLQQTGLGDVAEDLNHHRRLRTARRRRTRVLDGSDQPATRGRPWRKAALVATLRNRYGLRQAVARFLAGQIESRVFALNYRVLTKPFLTELVRNEVLAWGLADQQVLRMDIDACEHPVAPGPPKKES